VVRISKFMGFYIHNIHLSHDFRVGFLDVDKPHSRPSMAITYFLILHWCALTILLKGRSSVIYAPVLRGWRSSQDGSSFSRKFVSHSSLLRGMYKAGLALCNKYRTCQRRGLGFKVLDHEEGVGQKIYLLRLPQHGG